MIRMSEVSEMFRIGSKRIAWTVAVVMAGLTLSTSAQGQDQRGWLGISLQCTNCTQEERGGLVVWSFSSPPRVDLVVEGGPAAKAGLEIGDRIVAIDGVDLTTAEGGRLFGAMRSGVPAELRVLRDGRARTVAVTPAGSQEEAFGEWKAYVRPGGQWDSMRVQMKKLYENQVELRVALKEAENALARVELKPTAESRQMETELAERLRVQVDSINRALASSRKLLRLQADSLAVQAFLVRPSMTDVEIALTPSKEARTIVVYSDAVAGARFEELTEESPWLEVLPGVSEGLLIIKVAEGTPAHSAGLREGDVVLAVNDEPVRSVAQLRKVLRSSDVAELTYVRKGKKQTCRIPSR